MRFACCWLTSSADAGSCGMVATLAAALATLVGFTSPPPLLPLQGLPVPRDWRHGLQAFPASGPLGVVREEGLVGQRIRQTLRGRRVGRKGQREGRVGQLEGRVMLTLPFYPTLCSK